MLKPKDPRELAELILSRSTCAVQVGAALIDDKERVVSWGWNSSGSTGFGLHAEHHALIRANHKRRANTTIYVASVRKKSGSVILSKPCDTCQQVLKAFNVNSVWFRKADNTWEFLSLL